MKISLVMPIFNEEKLLPYHLEAAAPYVDEIILVNGSPTGPSTDATADMVEYDNVKMLEGTFEMVGRRGGWDKGGQLKRGVAESSGDMLIVTSCDSVYSDYELLVDTIKEHPDGKVYYCFLTEFFLDTEHVRLINDEGYPRPQVGYGIFPKRLFTTKEHTWFAKSLVEPEEYIFLQDLRKYHYGWVTDYAKQVEKHKRNVKSGLWLDYGETILNSGEQALDVWAINHVSTYPNEIIFEYAGTEYHPFSKLDFDYKDKFDEVISEFKKKHRKSYYDCI